VSRVDSLGWLLFVVLGVCWLTQWAGDALARWPRRGSNPLPTFERATKAELLEWMLSCDEIVAEMHSLRQKIAWRMEELRVHVHRKPARPPTVIHITKNIRSRDDVA